MEKLDKVFGDHFLVEYIGCDPNKLKFVEDIKEDFLRAAEVSKATVLEHYFHQFDPEGVSAMIFIAESHFSIHTWPEDHYASFDILTCGDMEPQRAIDALKESLGAKEVKVQVIQRGF